MPARKNVPFDKLDAALGSDSNISFCLGCGAEASDCEPDTKAREYTECHEPQVFGVQEILVMDAIQY